MIIKINIWLQSLIIAIAIVTIIELLLPEGNNKKYVKVICGIYILFIILNPITNLKNLDVENILNFELEKNVEKSSIDTQNITQIYINAFEEEMKKYLIQIGFNIYKVKVKIDNEDIEYVDIYVSQLDDENISLLKQKIKEKYEIENINIR